MQYDAERMHSFPSAMTTPINHISKLDDEWENRLMPELSLWWPHRGVVEDVFSKIRTCNSSTLCCVPPRVPFCGFLPCGENAENCLRILFSTKGYNRDFPAIGKPYRLLLSLDEPLMCASSRSAKGKMHNHKKIKSNIYFLTNSFHILLTWSPVPAKWMHTGLCLLFHLLGVMNWNLQETNIKVRVSVASYK